MKGDNMENVCEQIYEIIKQNKQLSEENGRMKSVLDIYQDKLLANATQKAKELIGNREYDKVRMVSADEIEDENTKNKTKQEIQYALKGLELAVEFEDHIKFNTQLTKVQRLARCLNLDISEIIF